MNNEQIITKLDLNSEDRQKVSAVMTMIEDTSPSDASVLFRLDKVEDKFVGTVSVRSQCVTIDVAEEDFDMENLLEILNFQCKEQIDQWKKDRSTYH